MEQTSQSPAQLLLARTLFRGLRCVDCRGVGVQDGMITHHDVLEVGSPVDRCQVVHWIRSFPFAFIGDREYVIARRQFRDANGCVYVVTKSVEHPRAPADDSAVRM